MVRFAITVGVAVAIGTPRSVRSVDFCNHQYSADLRLTKCTAETRTYFHDAGGGVAHDWKIYRLGKITYGDLDGDSAEEAAVLVEERDIGNGPPTGGRVFVYGVANDTLVWKGSLMLDARITRVTVERDAVRVETVAQDQTICRYRYERKDGHLARDDASTACRRRP